MSKPLENKLILITRSYEQSPVEMKLLEDNGAEVLPFPTIKIVPVDDYTEFDNQIKKFIKFDFLIFTSANAVEKFHERIENKGFILDFSRIKIVVLGSKTSDACYDVNLPVDIIPYDFSASGVIKELAENYEIEGRNFFIPGSSISMDELTRGLELAGGNVTFIPIYNTVKPGEEDFRDQLTLLKKRAPDIFIFTSPSSFRNFVEITDVKKNSYFKNSEVAAIGPTTKKEIEKDGIKVHIVPKNFTVEGIVEEIINRYSSDED